MAMLQIQQIKRKLNDSFVGSLELDDISHHGQVQFEQMSLTRALTAFIIHKVADLGIQDASRSVVDEPGDNGIDGLAISADSSRLSIVQSKWSDTGKGSADLSEMIKFRDGINDLVAMRWHKFGQKIQLRASELEETLLNPELKIDIIFVHMGSGSLAEVVGEKMHEFVADQNDSVGDSFSFSYLDQSAIHRLLIEERQAHEIDLSVTLSDWGILDGPPRAIYGHVLGVDVASWLNDHGEQLLAKNVRVFLSDTEVNKGIRETAQNAPEEFWYFNNGITVLCKSFDKLVAGGADRRIGAFKVRGASVVNGAQTVGALAQLAVGENAKALDDVRVSVRFISLDDAAEDFGTKVTRATNTQNRIGGRDFVGLDPEQERLRNEFAVEGLNYAVRSGEKAPDFKDGCTFDEAVVALACSSHDIDLATQAKREVSRLYFDTARPPYRTLFNSSTNSVAIWRRILVLRRVDSFLAELGRNAADSRARGYAVHGNRVVAHLVFSQIEHRYLDDASIVWAESLVDVEGIAASCYRTMTSVSERAFDGYLASLFKNSTKVREIRRLALDALASDSRDTKGV